MRITMVHTFWMRVTSLVPRVMSEAAENWLISASEKATTRANRRRRKSRPILAPVRADTKPAATSRTMEPAAASSMRPPMRRR